MSESSRASALPLPIDPDTIKVCVFDAYGTLFDVTSVIGDARRSLGDLADRLSELWRRKQLEYSWLRSIMGRYEDFWHVTGDALDHAMQSLGIRDALLRAELMQSWLSIAAYPRTAQTLETIRASGRRTAVLSNGSPSMLAAAVNHASLTHLLDAVLSVDAVKTYKPQPSVYALATERLAVAPHEVLFVSANGWDAAGAAAFGFRVAWINRANAPVEILPATPGTMVTELSGVTGLLRL